MRKLPILFSTEMVEATLAGRKCMTRSTHGLDKVNENPNEWKFRQWISEVQKPISIESDWRLLAEFENKSLGICLLVKAAYAVGDKIWVRERFETDTDGTVKFYAGNIEVKHNAAYRKLTKWKPGIHLFKKDARIWLECTGVRLERLQDISEADAIAEGIEIIHSPIFNEPRYKDYANVTDCWRSPISSFQSLWASINGVDSWDKNPWVFIYEFKGIQHA